MRRPVQCVYCGHVFLSRSDHPQCSVCRHKSVIDASMDVYNCYHDNDVNINIPSLSPENPLNEVKVERLTHLKDIPSISTEYPVEEDVIDGSKVLLLGGLALGGLILLSKFKKPNKKEENIKRLKSWDATLCLY